MSIISLMISVVVFVVCVVIIILIVKWGLAKAGVALDPALMTIIYLILFLFLLLLFLNFTGLWVWNAHVGRP